MARCMTKNKQPICEACTKRTGKPVLMVAGSSLRTIRYYYCPSALCSHSLQVPRQSGKMIESLEELEQRKNAEKNH